MGLLATVVVTLGSGSAVTALATSLRTWMVQRRSDLSLEIENEDGSSVKIDAKRVADAETLIRQVLSSSRDTDDSKTERQ